MQENLEKKSLDELRKVTDEIYQSMSRDEKSKLLDELVEKFGGSRGNWKHRMVDWQGYSKMNEYLERQVHIFISERAMLEMENYQKNNVEEK